MKPTILIAATSHWFPAARLAMALADAGCRVEAVCPAGHPLRSTQAVDRFHAYHGFTPLRSFARAIASARPELLIPGDDLAARHLYEFYRRERNQDQNRSDLSLCSLLERSLGAAESFPILYERAEFMRLAAEEGIRVPVTGVIADLDELRSWTARMGMPAVLKADGTSGGDGVRIAHTQEEAERAFRTLQAPPRMARAIKRALANSDKTLVWPSLLRRRHRVSAQTFVEGHEATSTVACWQGAVVAGLHFEVLNKKSSAGPATVMRWIDHPEMVSAVEKMVRRLRLSGLHGFDFMLEAQSGNAYLIEINPRTTQVGHLTLGPGRDLPAAMSSALSGTALRTAPMLTENDTITLFPQEWARDPESVFLRSGYHDVPWSEPELIRVGLRRAREQNQSKEQPNWSPALTPAPVRVPRL